MYAIRSYYEDAVAAANVLGPALSREGRVEEGVLGRIQKRRLFPTRVIQLFQSYNFV